MNKQSKSKQYKRIAVQLADLFKKTSDPAARASTMIALLHHKFSYFFWTGFYFLKEGELVVSSYQGPVACLVLEKDRGACWQAIRENRTIIIGDVRQYPDHIACDSRSRSEIVIQVRSMKNGIIGVLDVDSREVDSFDEVDADGLEKLVTMIGF